MTFEDCFTSAATLAVVSPRHWDPRSQPYAGADQLLSALSQGWQADAVVDWQDHGRGGRQIAVYGFVLVRQEQQRRMWVVANPCVTRLIADAALQVNAVAARPDQRNDFAPTHLRRPAADERVLRRA